MVKEDYGLVMPLGLDEQEQERSEHDEKSGRIGPLVVVVELLPKVGVLSDRFDGRR